MSKAPARRESQSCSRARTATPEWNPIVVREGRARWRGARAFWLALAYASFLSLVLWWCYNNSRNTQIANSGGQEPIDSIGTIAFLGHNLFATLCWWQLGAWLLLAPLLTSSALSGERQKGLLESLLLSRLSPLQIVRGKWISALGLMVLLQLAGLPVAAMCFLMGGVSPQEFVGAFAIQLATAACGASIGLIFSAQSRTNGDAASGSIGGVLIWLVGTGVACLFLNSNTYIPLLSECAHLMIAANPIAAMAMLLSPLPSANQSLYGLWSVFFAGGCGWVLAVAGMALVSAWCLRHASKILLLSSERLDQANAMQSSASTCTPPAPFMVAQERQEFHGERDEYPGARTNRRWEIPILRDIVFGNAMMRRELAHLWRWPATTRRQDGWMCLLSAICCCATLFAIMAVFDAPTTARDAWWVILGTYGVAGAIFCASRPASSIAHERDGGSWQSLSLTLLSPLHIAQGKVAGPVVAACGYGFGMWILLFLAAWRGHVALSTVVPSVLVMLLAWTQAASWSAFVGARTRVPVAALGWGLAGPIFAWLGIPGLSSLLGFNNSGFLPFKLLHPVVALGASTSAIMLLAFVLNGALATALFALAWRAVEASQRVEKISGARVS